MVRPRDMGPADLAPNTAPPETDSPREDAIAERNAFYNSLSPEAKERFLAELERAAAEGLDEESAWQRAVTAAETTYPPDVVTAPRIVDEPAADDNL